MDGRFVVAWGGNGNGEAEGVFVRSYGLSTTETGGTASFEVVLDDAPTADVSIPVTVSDAAEAVANLSTLEFTPLDLWWPHVFGQLDT